MSTLSESNSQKIKNMSVACALLVVTIHVGWPKDEVCFTWFVNEFVRHGVARIAVPFFFVVSGFFLAAHFDEREWWKSETAKRIHSLVGPFFLWCGIAFLLISPLSIVADLMAHRPFGTNLPVSDGRWLKAIGLDLSVCPNLFPLWYVRCLFLFVLLSPLFKFAVERFRLLWLILAFTATTMFSSACHFPDDAKDVPSWIGFFKYGISLSGVFYFSVGIFIRRFRVSVRSNALAVACVISSGVWLIARTLARLNGGDLPIWTDSLFLLAMLYAVWHVMPSWRIPSWLTHCSFPIFLCHVIFLSYGGIVAKYFSPLGEQTNALLNCLASIAASIVLANLLRKIAPRFAKIIFAGR